MLDWVVPVRLSGKRMSVEVERGVKIMLSLILLATIPYHAINKTLDALPPDAADSVVWTKFSLYLLCDIVVYIGVIAGILLLKPFVLELIEISEEFIKKRTGTSDKDPLIQEIVPIVTVDRHRYLCQYQATQSREFQNRNLKSRHHLLRSRSHKRQIPTSRQPSMNRPSKPSSRRTPTVSVQVKIWQSSIS